MIQLLMTCDDYQPLQHSVQFNYLHEMFTSINQSIKHFNLRYLLLIKLRQSYPLKKYHVRRIDILHNHGIILIKFQIILYKKFC